MHAVVDCSCRRNIYMKHFSTIAPQLFYSYPIVEEEREQIDGILGLLEYSGVAEYLETGEAELPQTGRPGYNPCDLFAAITMGFALDMLLTPEGIEMRVNRSCQVEGTFGSLKSNMSYDRFRRTSFSKVDAEMMLTCLGYNMRKYMRFIEGKARFSYWKAPADTRCGEFKKPSSKRLKNSVGRIRRNDPNDISRDYHKHKKRYK